MMIAELNASHGTIESKKDVLVKDLKGVVGDAGDLIKTVADSTAEGFTSARTKVGERLGEAKSRYADARLAVTERARSIAGTGHEYLRENPWKALGVAAAVGLMISFLFKRH
jgi:ElaB/YqjD/DUF883 family membrane-anchored ribosome-binding protein